MIVEGDQGYQDLFDWSWYVYKNILPQKLLIEKHLVEYYVVLDMESSEGLNDMFYWQCTLYGLVHRTNIVQNGMMSQAVW